MFAQTKHMSQTKNCPHCNTPFNGRANRIYCSDSCKNQKNNTRDTALRKDSRFFANVMERNERILRAFMARPEVNSEKIPKIELQAFGFNTAGPFIVSNGGYIVGEYYVKEHQFIFYTITKSLEITKSRHDTLEKLFPGKPKA